MELLPKYRYEAGIFIKNLNFVWQTQSSVLIMEVRGVTLYILLCLITVFLDFYGSIYRQENLFKSMKTCLKNHQTSIQYFYVVIETKILSGAQQLIP